MANEKFPGVPMVLDGARYLIPSLSLRQLHDNYELIAAPIDTVTNENLQTYFVKYLPVIHLAIGRNYSDITEENLQDWLGITTFSTALAIVKGVSGLQEVSPGE
jgi:hypothetical protein